MKPLSNHLLVEPIIYKYHGLVALPPSMEDSLNTGGVKLFRVHAVGPGRVTRKGVRVPMEIIPTDYVLCMSYTEGPREVGTNRLVLSEDMVLAVIPAPEHERAAV